MRAAPVTTPGLMVAGSLTSATAEAETTVGAVRELEDGEKAAHTPSVMEATENFIALNEF